MRGVTIKLPEVACSKLEALEFACDAALEGARTAANKLAGLPRDADASLRERWNVERDKQSRRQSDLNRLLSAVRQWLFEQRRPVAVVPPIDFELKPNEKLADVLAATRDEICAVRQRLAQVRSAPLRKSSQQDAVAAYLTRLGQGARPKIVFDVKGNASVRWADDVITGKDDILSLLAFALGPEQLATAFTRLLEQEPERADALSPQEREKKLGELRDALMRCEQIEEQLIIRAAENGITIDRRPDIANLCVLLGVVVVAPQAQAVQVA